MNSSEYKDSYNLLQSSNVNWALYQEQLPQSAKDPIDWFLKRYHEFPLVIEDYFDSRYYLGNNPDVEKSGVNPLVHFLVYGDSEGRAGYPVDSEAGIQEENSESTKGLEESIIHIDAEKKSGFKQHETGGIIEDQKTVKPQPVHYPVESTAQSASLKQGLLGLDIEWSAVLEDIDVKSIDDAIDIIIENSYKRSARVAGFFDQQLYESIYPDIKKSPVNALEHYVWHGLSEGRVGWLSPDEFFQPGGREYVQGRDTVIIVSHDATATGAPVVALEVADRFAEKYNVITVVLKGGTLGERFVQAGFLHLDAPLKFGIDAFRYLFEETLKQYRIRAVLLNSVESLPFLDVAVALGLPTVSLLHEFAEYTRPVGKMTHALIASDVVIYPAETLKKSGLKELREKTIAENEPNNIWIKPQGYLGFKTEDVNSSTWSLRDKLGLDDDAIVIIGAGHVQPRKGVDWFLETCFYLYSKLNMIDHLRAEKLQFVWIGNGFHEDDILVSAWLETFMQRNSFRERCHFPGAVHDVSAAFSEADIYLLSSKLDPFPNVAIDALNQDCAIGLFEGASGIVDFVKDNKLRSVVAPYGDTYRLAEKLAREIDSLIVKDGRNSTACEKNLKFDNYIEVLQSAVQEAVERRCEILKVINESDLFNKRFNAEFYRLKFNGVSSAQHFLSLLYKGVVFAKPFPGSDITTAVASTPYEPKESFIAYVESLFEKTVKDMPVIKISGLANDRYRGSIAIQFHVYYNDLIPVYCDYFKTLHLHDVDLYVSHVHDISDIDMAILEGSVSGKVYTWKTDNFGRDVYPFHKQYVNNILENYDVVGHFHTKKSLDVLDGTGDRWRTYLLGNLIGSTVAVGEILSLFNDENTGLVFAEDAHCINETLNGPYIEDLLKKFGYKRREAYRNFPLGTMFWARSEALRCLSEISEDTFRLSEPVPYDGTYLHAFERIIPQLVQEAGYKVKRIYTAGTHW